MPKLMLVWNPKKKKKNHFSETKLILFSYIVFFCLFVEILGLIHELFLHVCK